MRLLRALVLVAALGMPQPAVAVDDATLINQLVAGSPWKGENVGERGLGSVTYDVTFKKDAGGGLAGVVSNYSIPAFANIANGPIKKPSLKNGLLKFETNRTGALTSSARARTASGPARRCRWIGPSERRSP
jgi:hypothetical protein